MRLQQIITVLTLILSMTVVNANHPGENIDQYMKGQEKYFQVINIPNAPSFTLVDEIGNSVSLSDFEDKVVILNFIFTNCQDVCPLHSAVIANIQEKINITAMKENVQFITITTDPGNDTSGVLKKYGESHNLDPVNWKFLTAAQSTPESTTRDLSQMYNVRFEPVKDGQQMHGAVTHIIDKDGRFAAKFHGLKFDDLNVVLYVNGLINNWYSDDDHHSKNLWDKFMDFLTPEND